MRMHRTALYSVVALLVAIASPALAASTGHGEVGLWGEGGDYMYVQVDTADPGVTLTRATFDFTGLPVHLGTPWFMVPTINHGVTSYSPFTTSRDPAVFGFTATGFSAGDSLQLPLDHLEFPNGSPALPQDLLGGKLTLDFSNNTENIRLFSLTITRPPDNTTTPPTPLLRAAIAPVPEPASLTLLGIGMFGVLGYARHVRRRAAA